MSETFTTVSGKRWKIGDPDASLVSPYDIAVALANLCRYSGHAQRFYSVAEHCLLVADIVWRKTRDPLLALMALLHDAAEAYPPGDVMAPAKRMRIMREPVELQVRVEEAIADA